MNFGLPPLSNGFHFADTMDLMNSLKRKRLISGSIALKTLVKTFSIKKVTFIVNLIKVSSKAAKKFGFENFDSYLTHDETLHKEPNRFIY